MKFKGGKLIGEKEGGLACTKSKTKTYQKVEKAITEPERLLKKNHQRGSGVSIVG